jgi:hypothetical protein
MTRISFTKKELSLLSNIVSFWYVDESNDRTEEEIKQEKELLEVLRQKILFQK